MIDKVGIDEGLSLPPSMAIVGTLHCAPVSQLTEPRQHYIYTYRVTIDKEVNDNAVKRFATLTEYTDFGISSTHGGIVNRLNSATRIVANWKN
jgi:hypothetical protein